MQTFGASERKRKDAAFPLNVLPPSLPGVPVSLPSQLTKCRAIVGVGAAGLRGLWTNTRRASEAAGELSI